MFAKLGLIEQITMKSDFYFFLGSIVGIPILTLMIFLFLIFYITCHQLCFCKENNANLTLG